MPENGGFEVVSEATVVQHNPTGRRFIIVCLAKGPLSAPEAPRDERLGALGVGLKLEIRRCACTLMTLYGRSSSYLFMPRPLTQYSVFIGSPEGLDEERQFFRDTLRRFNENHGQPDGVRFEPTGGKTRFPEWDGLRN
jgi:hypothetical protein